MPKAAVAMMFVRLITMLLLLAPLSTAVLAQGALDLSHPPAGGQAEQRSQQDQSLSQLIEILQNDQNRQALIERLQDATDDETGQGDGNVGQNLSVARQLADYTRALSKTAGQATQALGHVVQDFQGIFDNAEGGNWGQLRTAAFNLLAVASTLFGGLMALRLLVRPLQRRVASGLPAKPRRMRIGGTVSAALIDGLSVLFSWGLGYAVALTLASGGAGEVGINETLLLNAFLLVELGKLLVHTLFSPRFTAFRWLPLSDSDAAYWSFSITRLISVLGYTFLLIAPMLTANVSRDASAVVQVLAMTAAIALCIIVVLQCKAGVRRWSVDVAAARANDGLGQVLLVIGRYWHIVAIAYLVTLLIAWLANPRQALPFMVAATVQTAISILAGAAISAVISRLVHFGLGLPEDIRESLPLLETRLQAFVPRVLQIVRLVVVVGVVLAVAQAWSLFDVLGWISSARGQEIIGSVISAALIVLACIVCYIVVASWIEFRLNPNIGTVPTAREKTLLSLFKNAFTIALVVFGVMLALAQIGVNIAPLLAGAGVLGLAIGFGAQKLVQDIITGVFIQFENVMNEGDVVEAGGKSGVVEKLTIRSVSIRDLSGTLHLIPFSSVDLVSNMVKGFSFHLAEIGVSYDSDIEEVKQALRDAFDLLLETEHKNNIIDELDMQGVIAFADSAIVVRIRIKTLPGKHWAAGRRYSEIVKTIFDERGIEIPYPHVTYVQSKEGRDPLPPQAADISAKAIAP